VKDGKKAISMRTKILLSCISCTLLALIVQTVLFQQSSSGIIFLQAQEISRNTLNNLQDDEAFPKLQLLGKQP
jgi:hypothetical protein